MSRGVVYVATGHDYIATAAMSIGSLRCVHHGDIMLLTDTDVPCLHKIAKHFDVDVVVYDTKEAHAGRSARILKTQAAALCPYDPAVFLDADTMVFKSIEPLWTAPTVIAPIAMTLGTAYQTVGALNNSQMMTRPSIRFDEEYKLTRAIAGPDAPYYSSSTMAWHRTPALLKLFRTWYLEWQRIRISDMPALARALAITGVGVVPLSACFNARNKFNAKTVVFTARPERMHPVYAKLPKLHKVVSDLLRR